MNILRGRVIKEGLARGTALVSRGPISFLGGVNPETGIVIEPEHELEGECISGRILVFPTAKGSTAGSYILYGMAKNGVAPAAIVNEQSEAIVAVGAIIAEIPMVDNIATGAIGTGDVLEVEGEEVRIL
jgi:predicted aconitase with swiveling domain